jgi:hypothetical protein
VEERPYVGFFGVFTGISDGPGTSFSGKYKVTLIHSAGVTIKSLVPKIKENYGFGGLVGYRHGDYGVEISYWRSEHKAEYKDSTTTFQDKAVYHSFNLDLKRFLFTHLPVQPFVSGGLSFPWIVVNNASIIDGTDYLWTVSFSGMGFNLGVGLEFFVLPNVTITGGAVRRWSDYGYARAADRQNTKIYLITPDEPVGIRDASFNFYAGATIDFM